jgi:hypothetical protein
MTNTLAYLSVASTTKQKFYQHRHLESSSLAALGLNVGTWLTDLKSNMLANVLTDRTSPVLGSSTSDHLASLSLSSTCSLAELRRFGAKIGVEGIEEVKDEADDDDEY